MMTTTSNVMSSPVGSLNRQPNDLLLPYELWCKIFSYMQASDLGRCAQVCTAWKIVADDEGLWKQIVRSQVLGKKVWEEARVGDVGDEPEYRMAAFNGMDGEEIPWKEVCKMHKNPSSYLDQKNGRMIKMPEFDFLVPATIQGHATTIRHVIEVFANARLPIGFGIDPDTLDKYGDVPIKESYFARYTWTVLNETRGKDPDVLVVEINKKGQGLYRLPKIIEMMIFHFLSNQAGIESGYGRDIWTWSQCVETKTIHGRECPIYAGAFKKPSFGCNGILGVSYNVGVGESTGAGGLLEL